jgi:hypothetical protein
MAFGHRAPKATKRHMVCDKLRTSFPDFRESTSTQGLCDDSPPSVILIPLRKLNGSAGKPGAGS